MYRISESDKHFLWSLLGALGIILFWRGVWDGIAEFSEFSGWYWIGTPALSLFVGLMILTLSGMIFKEFDPLGGLEKGVLRVLHLVHNHPKRKDFSISYYDNIRKKEIRIAADSIRKIERNVLSIHEGGKEIFIPIHRVRNIRQKEKMIWKL